MGESMGAYPKEYLDEVVETQGKLFLFIAENFAENDTMDFIEKYMKSNTRKAIDNAMAYVCTMDKNELLEYFIKTEGFEFQSGKNLEGFLPDWIGEFYAYYQWYYSIPSTALVEKITPKFLATAYPALHDLDLEEAVKKVGMV